MHVEFRRNDNAIRARYATDASYESEGGNTSSNISVPKLVGRLESQIIVHGWHLFLVYYFHLHVYCKIMTICDCDIILLLLKMYIYYLFVLIVPNLNVIFFLREYRNQFNLQMYQIGISYFVIQKYVSAI